MFLLCNHARKEKFLPFSILLDLIRACSLRIFLTFFQPACLMHPAKRKCYIPQGTGQNQNCPGQNIFCPGQKFLFQAKKLIFALEKDRGKNYLSGTTNNFVRAEG